MTPPDTMLNLIVLGGGAPRAHTPGWGSHGDETVVVLVLVVEDTTTSVDGAF